MNCLHLPRRAALAAILCFAIPTVPTLAATIVADGTDCTLAEAILSANNDSAEPGCAAGSGADTVILDADVTLTAADTTNSTQLDGTYAGLPDVVSDITIRAGLGAAIERSFFSCSAPIDSPGEYRLINVTGTNSALLLDGVRLSRGCAVSGGAVFVDGGASLTAIGSRFTDNDAFERGGAIRTQGNGLLEVRGSEFAGNSISGTTLGNGGAIDVASGLTALADNRFTGNAILVDDLASAIGRGGAVHIDADATPLGEIVDNVFIENSISGLGAFRGGALFVAANPLAGQRLDGNLFGANAAGSTAGEPGGDPNDNEDGEARGGALYLARTFSSFRDNRFIGNHALANGSGNPAQGGAEYRTVPVTSIGASYLANIASNGSSDTPAAGGALYTTSVGTQQNSTFAENRVLTTGGDAYGGAIFDAGASPLQGDHLTIARNSVDSSSGTATGGGLYSQGGLSLSSTILADNLQDPDGSATPDDCGILSTLASSRGFNLVEAPGNCAPALVASDITGSDPQLAPPDDYGCADTVAGACATTLAFVSESSPAIDAGSCAVSGLATDQRGFARPIDLAAANAADGCDIGALESRAEDVIANPDAWIRMMAPRVRSCSQTEYGVAMTAIWDKQSGAGAGGSDDDISGDLIYYGTTEPDGSESYWQSSLNNRTSPLPDWSIGYSFGAQPQTYPYTTSFSYDIVRRPSTTEDAEVVATETVVLTCTAFNTGTVQRSSALPIEKSTSATSYAAVGEVIDYSYQVTNRYVLSVDNLTVTDDNVDPPGVVCPVTSLAVGESTTCSAQYTITQADLDDGTVVNTATATAESNLESPDFFALNGNTLFRVLESTSGSVSVAGQQTASMTVGKTADVANYAALGEVITYSYPVENTGNVTLDNLAVTDDNVDAQPTCPLTTLAPGQSTTCTATRTVTQTDLDAGSITNTASAQATDPNSQPVTAGPVSVTANAQQSPVLTLDKTADVSSYASVGDVISYSYPVENTGNVTLDALAITDDNVDAQPTCPLTTLSPGQSTSCTATRTVTQTDLDAGSITNTASAQATDPNSQPVTAGPVSLTINAGQNPSLSLSGSSDPTTFDSVGQVLDYTYEATNTGNVSLSGLTVNDTLNGSANCPTDTLAPGMSTTCTAQYTIARTDLIGVLTAVAVSTALDPEGVTVAASGVTVEAVSTFVPKIPTLSTWSMWLMMLAVLGFGATAIRRLEP